MASEYEALRFKITGNSTNAIKNIEKLQTTLRSLNRLSKNIDNKNLDAMSHTIKKVGEALNQLGQVKPSTQGINRVVKAIDSLSSIYKKAEDVSKLSEVSKGLDSFASTMNNLGNIQEYDFAPFRKNITSLVDTFKAVDADTIGKMKSMAYAMAILRKSGLKVQLPKVDKSNEESSISETASSLDAVKGKIGNLTYGSKVFLSTIKNDAGNAMKFLGSSFLSKVNNLSKGFDKLSSSIGRIAMYRAIRTVMKDITAGIQEGLQNCYQWSLLTGNQFASSMDMMATSGLYAKNSLGALGAPLFNMIAPFVDALIDKFVSLLNIINQALAVLGGSGKWIKAIKQPKSYADAIGSTGSAAKKAKKEIDLYLASFDELHVIPKQNDPSSGGGGGGGGSGLDYSTMFEEQTVSSSIKDFVQSVKDAISKGDWKSAGVLLGEKVNSIVDSVDYESIGHKLGYGINGAIQTLYFFLDTVDFKGIGAHFAELMNGTFSEIDFQYVGRLLVKKFTVGLDVFIGLVSNLDYATIAKGISAFIIGAFDEGTKWINSYDWGELASTTVKNIAIFLANVDYTGIAKSLFKLIGAGFGAIGSFMAQLSFDIVLKPVLDWFKSCWDSADGDWIQFGGNIVSGILLGILDGIASIGTWIVDNVFTPMFDGFCSAFGIHSPATKLIPVGGYIIGGVLGGLIGGVGEVFSWIGNFASETIEWFGSAWTTVKQNTEDTWNNVSSFLGDKWDSLKASASDKFDSIKSSIGSAWDKVKNVSETTWDKVSTSVSNKWNAMKDKSSDIFTGIEKGISNKWDSIKQFSADKWESIKSSASVTWGKIKTAMTSPIEHAKNNIRGIVDTIKGFFNFQISFPHIPLPHFGIRPYGWDIGDLLKGKIPSLSIDWYAQGGFPDTGEMFMARENGPEMVGKIGGRNAVANNDQIVQAISRGVKEAVSEAFSGGNGDGNIYMTINLDGEVVYKDVVKRNNDKVKRTGESDFVV